MRSRRALLAAVAAGLAGCNTRPNRRPTLSPTQVPSGTPEPYPSTVADRFGTSRFEADAVCPGDIPCFHQVADHERPDAVMVPDAERVTSESPQVTLKTYNVGDEPLVLAEERFVAKDHGVTWAAAAPFHGTTGTVVVQPGESLERQFGITGRGDGRYAVVEHAGWGGPTGTVPRTVESRFETDRFRFGAMVEVSGSTWTPAPAGLATERDGDTLHVLPETDSTDRVVLQLDDAEEGIPLVPETVATHPPTNDAVLGLRAPEVRRATTPTPELSMAYLREALIYSQPIPPGRTLRFEDTLFTARVE